MGTGLCTPCASAFPAVTGVVEAGDPLPVKTDALGFFLMGGFLGGYLMLQGPCGAIQGFGWQPKPDGAVLKQGGSW